MLIKLNGSEKDISAGLTISALLGELKLTPDKVAVELNRRLVREKNYDTVLKEGDQLEVVTFVGGG
jgi:thiamine biosynthesis protein ThiS